MGLRRVSGGGDTERHLKSKQKTVRPRRGGETQSSGRAPCVQRTPRHGPRVCMPAHVPEGVWQRESRRQEAFSGMLWNFTVILEIVGVTERCLPYLCQRNHFSHSHIDSKPQCLYFVFSAVFQTI